MGGIMRNHSNTIFITGGGSGIGRGLAEAFHKLGNHVVIGGRREAVLRDTCAANPGMSYAVLDVASPDSVRTTAQTVIAKFPELNCVVNNAGVQRAKARRPGAIAAAAVHIHGDGRPVGRCG